MGKNYSIRTGMIIGFMGVLIPIVVFILIYHFNARELVRTKVMDSYSNTLDIFVRQFDDQLTEIDNYLLKLSVIDIDVGILSMFDTDSNYYMLSKIRIQNKLVRDVGVHNSIHTVFVYHDRDVIFATDGEYESIKKIVNNHMKEINERYERTGELVRQWEIRSDPLMPGEYFLINSREVQQGLFTGAIIRIMDIGKLLQKQWHDAETGVTGIFETENGQLKRPLTAALPPVGWNDLQIGAQYQPVRGEKTDESYLALVQSSSKVKMAYQVLITETALLQSLLFFQRVALFAPVVFLILLSVYLILLRKLLFKPLHELILGMKKIARGMLDVRLSTEKTAEFAFLANTFNQMAEQIKTLKIDIYEEQLRVKQGQLKQLQSQINPHFYMNSLNIIYNLAALNDSASVKKMSLHLAEYFRFIMRTDRETINLEEELAHIRTYLDIQQMRFPDKLEYRIEAPEELKCYQIAALTLQPFVENAIIHGFKNRRQTFKIAICCEYETQDGKPSLKVTVADNGVGYAPEALERLRSGRPVSDTSLGIMNVRERLSIMYDGQARIEFDNDGESGGARVVIRCPIRQEEVKAIV
jgi:Putative regulator of cell autolysis